MEGLLSFMAGTPLWLTVLFIAVFAAMCFWFVVLLAQMCGLGGLKRFVSKLCRAVLPLLALSLFGSCYQSVSDETTELLEPEEINLVLRFTQYDYENFTPAATDITELCSRLNIAIFDEDDAVRGRRIYQPFKDFDYRRNEAMMAQNAKWDNISQVFAQADRQADLQVMGLAALVQKANTLTQDIEQLMQQRQTEQASYMVGEMKAARDENEALFLQTMQYLNALLVVSPDAALEDCAAYMQQDFNKVDLQYQQGRHHATASDTPDTPDGGGEVTPVQPEAAE